MDIQLLTDKPHSEADILSYNPVIYKIGEIILRFELQSFKAYTRFERGIRIYTAKAFGGLQDENINELDKLRLEIGNWWEPGFGLPWFLCQFAEIADMEVARPLLEEHFKQHPKLIQGVTEDYKDLKFLRFMLCDYLFYNLRPDQFVEICQELIYLQSNIKKKVLAILEKAQEKPSEKAALHPLSASRASRASKQRKLLRLAASSSSSQ
jgi:hypothetical protein